MGKPATLRSKTLARLEKQLKKTKTGRANWDPKALKLGQIRDIPELFPENRNPADDTGRFVVHELRKACRENEGPLGEATVGVLPDGGYFYIDGRHRVQAYRLAFEEAGDMEIPVRVFRGDLAEVLEEAARLNRTVSRNSTVEERAERTWVIDAQCPDRYSIRALAKITGTSTGTIGNQRTAREKLRTEHPRLNPVDMTWKEVKFWERMGHFREEGDPDAIQEAQAKKDGHGTMKVYGRPEKANPARIVRGILQAYPHLARTIAEGLTEDEEAAPERDPQALPFGQQEADQRPDF